MSHGRLKDGRWYYACEICKKLPVVMDNQEQAEAADALHSLGHRDAEEDGK